MMTSTSGLEAVPAAPFKARKWRMYEGQLTRQAAEISKVRGWMDRNHGYVPAAWAIHQLGISPSSIAKAKSRGWVRSEKFRANDGTILELVSGQDVARIAPRRRSVAPPAVKPSRAKGERGGTRGRTRAARRAPRASRRQTTGRHR